VILRHADPHESCDRPATTFATGQQLEDELKARYDRLKLHLRGRLELQGGSPSKSIFLDHWEKNFALNLAQLPASDPKQLHNADAQKRRDAILREAVPAGIRGLKIRLDRAVEKARNNACKQ
jgi:hypothetical protein